MILEREQSQSVYDMSKVAHKTIKGHSVNGIMHKLRTMIAERSFKDDHLEINGIIYPAEVVSGYVIISLPDETKTPAHIFVWEQEYGPVPKGYQIHHISGNSVDNRLINLALMSAPEHIQLHMAGRLPETFALFSFLQEKGLWNEYLTYRDTVIDLAKELK
jgi:hypothetical protein